MKLITIEQARMHVKSDGDDDELLTTYCNAAEAQCARLANRTLFATSAEKAAAVATIGTRMAAAYTAYDAAIAAAGEADDSRVTIMMSSAATTALRDATVACESDAHGLALDLAEDSAGLPGKDAIVAAVLLMVGHLYANRTTVMTGQGAAAVEVPQGTADIMTNYRWNGPEFI